MNMATIEHPLFTQLRGEHREIISYLNELDGISKKQDLKELVLKLWKTAELGHHYKEEVLLFAEIYQKPKISEGGPMCSLFFDFHMMERVKETVETITKKPLTIEDHQTCFINSQSPLLIPLEEHRSGKDLLSYIINNFEQMSEDVIKKNMEIYKKIQMNHIHKEENCMYHMCASLLTEHQADKILENWKK